MTLVLLALAPALAATLVSGLRNLRREKEEARAEVLRHAWLAAAEQAALVGAARQTLATLTELPEVREPADLECDALLARLLAEYPHYANIGVASAQGDIYCSALPIAAPVKAAHRSWFRRVVETGDFAVGEFQIGTITKRASINFGFPIRDPSGSLLGVVFAALDLEWLGQSVTGTRLPEGGAFVLLDAAGTILTRVPDPARWTGRSAANDPLVATILREREGVVEVAGLDGVRRLHAFTPVPGSGERLFVAVGVSTDLAYAAARRSLAASLAALALGALLGLALARAGSEVLVLRTTRRLLAAIRGLAAGDLRARSGLTGTSGEFGAVGLAFDEMAEALERKEEERRRAAAEVLEASEAFRVLFESSPVAIVGLDRDRNVRAWNPAAEALFGWTREEVLGHPIPIVPPEGMPEFERRFAQVLDGERLASFETRRRTKSGGAVDVARWVAPLRNLSGEVVGAVGMFLDVRDRKRAEEALRASHEQLRALAARLERAREEEKTRIARQVHDDLGQALTALKLELAALANRLPADGALAERTASMEALLGGTIDRVRAIAIELRPAVLDSLGLVAAIEWQAQEFALRTGILCRAVATVEDAILDPALATTLFRILQEALTNVARHAGARSVQISLREEEGRIVLEVRDDGVGITEEQTSGIGSLGLLSIRERALLLGGEALFRGEPGKGTMVRVRVPARARAEIPGGGS